MKWNLSTVMSQSPVCSCCSAEIPNSGGSVQLLFPFCLYSAYTRGSHFAACWLFFFLQGELGNWTALPSPWVTWSLHSQQVGSLFYHRCFEGLIMLFNIKLCLSLFHFVLFVYNDSCCPFVRFFMLISEFLLNCFKALRSACGKLFLGRVIQFLRFLF